MQPDTMCLPGLPGWMTFQNKNNPVDCGLFDTPSGSSHWLGVVVMFTSLRSLSHELPRVQGVNQMRKGTPHSGTSLCDSRLHPGTHFFPRVFCITSHLDSCDTHHGHMTATWLWWVTTVTLWWDWPRNTWDSPATSGTEETSWMTVSL